MGAQTVNRRFANETHNSIDNDADVQALIADGVRDRILM